MFSILPRGSYIDERICRNYGKEVLLANWQELRQGSAEKNDCITPGLKRVGKCIHHISEQRDEYRPVIELDDPDETLRQFRDMRNEALHNFKRNEYRSIRFPLVPEMMNNFSTTYTLAFGLVPQLLRSRAKAVKASGGGDGGDGTDGECSLNFDMLLSYGNRSKTGARCRRQRDARLEQLGRMQTTYAAEYDSSKLLSALR